MPLTLNAINQGETTIKSVKYMLESTPAFVDFYFMAATYCASSTLISAAGAILTVGFAAKKLLVDPGRNLYHRIRD